MEGAVIIATEDNTQIYVNNELLPVATINTGKYFVIPDTKYILQGNGHYNLYIRTTKNAYVYQILAGDSGSGNEVATGGFNFIPALNCYLPNKSMSSDSSTKILFFPTETPPEFLIFLQNLI
jgi:hypothetical protein